jgi:hypothetical protein
VGLDGPRESDQGVTVRLDVMESDSTNGAGAFYTSGLEVQRSLGSLLNGELDWSGYALVLVDYCGLELRVSPVASLN